MKKILLPSLMLLMVNMLKAQYGRLDQTFTHSGFTKLSIGKDDSSFQSVAKQAFQMQDGKIILLYESGGMTLLARKNSDGSIDQSYRNNGYSTPVPVTGAKAIKLSDDKIVVAGSYAKGYIATYDRINTVLFRFNTDGTLDKTFAGTGQIDVGLGAFTDLKQAPDGKLVISSVYIGDVEDHTVISYLRRLTTGGNLDLNIASGGDAYFISSIAVQNNGKIITGGNTLRRFNINGSKDLTFGVNGEQTLQVFTNSLAVQNDSKILAGSSSNFTVFRFSNNGIVDSSFGINGIQSINTVGVSYTGTNSIVLQPDGKILIAGLAKSSNVSSFAIARYTNTGFPDNSFSGAGILTTNFTRQSSAIGVSVLNDGKIIAVGQTESGAYNGGSLTKPYYNAAIAKYDALGNMDNSFDGDGKVEDHIRRTNTSFTAIAVQPDGKVINAGYSWNGKDFDFLIVRYNSDATLDNTFSGDGIQVLDFGSSDKANAVSIQSDGKIIVAGESGGDFAIARYNTNGILDNTFGVDGKVKSDFGQSESITGLKIQTDGKILVCGSSIVARYITNGTIDNSFNGNGRRGGYDCLDIQPDGKIVLGSSGIGNGACAITRLLTNGDIDAEFTNDLPGTIYLYTNETYDVSVSGIKVLPNGNILAVTTIIPYSKSSSEDPSLNLALVYPTKDRYGYNNTSWPLKYPQLNEAFSMALQSDGKLLVAGEKFIDGVKNFSILRLNQDYSLDSSFGIAGIQTTRSVTTGNSAINSIAISGNKVYAAGYGLFPTPFGVLARYTLGDFTAPTVELPITTNTLKLKLSPNPVKDLLYVQLNTVSKVDKTMIEIAGLDGKKWDQKIISATGKTSLPVDISKLPNGIYTMTVYTNGTKSTSTFIKQ